MPKNRRKMPATARPRVIATVTSFAELGRVVAAADRAAAERLKRSAPLRKHFTGTDRKVAR